MIRGILLVGFGFTLGYGKALYNSNETKELIREATALIMVMSKLQENPVKTVDFVDDIVVSEELYKSIEWDKHE